MRAATTAFGAGFGAGSAYADCQREASVYTCETHQKCLPAENEMKAFLCSLKVKCQASCNLTDVSEMRSNMLLS